MQVNIQGVKHNLWWIDQIDSRLCNNELQLLQQQLQLHKLCFFNWDALAEDAVGQNLIPDDNFKNSRESWIWRHKSVMKKLKVVEVLRYNGVNMKVISTKDYSQDGFITLKHACSLSIFGFMNH